MDFYLSIWCKGK